MVVNIKKSPIELDLDKIVARICAPLKSRQITLTMARHGSTKTILENLHFLDWYINTVSPMIPRIMMHSILIYPREDLWNSRSSLRASVTLMLTPSITQRRKDVRSTMLSLQYAKTWNALPNEILKVQGHHAIFITTSFAPQYETLNYFFEWTLYKTGMLLHRILISLNKYGDLLCPS